jgi:trehalose 6-phosphate synthase
MAIHGGTWIAAAISDGDRAVAKERPGGSEAGGFDLRLLDLPRAEHAHHYDTVSNEYLWFLFHYLFDTANTPLFGETFAQAWTAYRAINQRYADAVQVASPAHAVLVHDYHLMLVGDLLRRRGRSRRPILYFHHTPWCDPDYFSILPDDIAKEILQGLLAYDVIGFHARRWADAFLACCERFLAGASVSADHVTWRRRSSRIVIAPVPLDTERLAAAAAGPEATAWSARHDEMRDGRKLLLRVDRIDLSKNPLRGFLAFETLLERRPALAGEILFLALLYPSRLNVETYRRYYAECTGVVRRVNDRFEQRTKSATGPIELVFEDQYERSLGAMRVCDALLVNPIFDGLNLVAKEGAFVNERSGALILSRNAGVYEELGDAALPINPFDITETADAIASSLSMPEAQRVRMSARLRKRAARSSPEEWIELQLAAAGVS